MKRIGFGFILVIFCIGFLPSSSYAQKYPTFQVFLNGKSPLIGKYQHPYRLWETSPGLYNNRNLRFSLKMGPGQALRMSRGSLRTTSESETSIDTGWPFAVAAWLNFIA